MVQGQAKPTAERGRRVLRRGWCGGRVARRMRWRRSCHESMPISRRRARATRESVQAVHVCIYGAIWAAGPVQCACVCVSVTCGCTRACLWGACRHAASGSCMQQATGRLPPLTCLPALPVCASIVPRWLILILTQVMACPANWREHDPAAYRSLHLDEQEECTAQTHGSDPAGSAAAGPGQRVGGGGSGVTPLALNTSAPLSAFGAAAAAVQAACR